MKSGVRMSARFLHSGGVSDTYSFANPGNHAQRCNSRAFAHYGRAFRRGARRIDSQSSITGLHHIAAQNSDGEYALVISNPGEAEDVTAGAGEQHGLDSAQAEIR